MICPNCGKSNQCPCKNCDPNGDKPNKYTWIDALTGVVRCHFCGSEFNEQSSSDYEWSLMIDGYRKKLNPELCAIWFESKNKNDLYLLHDLDSLAFIIIFREYYKVDPYNLKMEDWLVIKRDYKITNIIE